MASYSGTALTPLVGRERELHALESRLAAGARLVTLLGPGGSGKTRLAREAFDRGRTPGSEAYFVDLVGISDPDLVPAEIASELSITETPELDAAAAVAAALRERSGVLFLDNLEELTGARDFLAELLRFVPGLQLVATGRIPLGIQGEIELQIPPLELPRGNEPGEVEASPAAALFLERARAVGRLDEIDEAVARDVAELCRRLDGLPLALELAAARTRIMTPAAILRHLEGHTSGLLAKAGQRDARHESLDAVLSWSLDLLEPNEAETLSAVAICPIGFDLRTAEALAPDVNVLQAIDILASQGLLRQHGEVEGEAWYQLLETIRSAALARAPEGTSVGRWKRLATHIAEEVAGTYETYNRNDETAMRRLDAILENVRAALDWTAANDPSLNLAIAAPFSWYWSTRGRWREGIPRLHAAIGANPNPSFDLALAYRGLSGLERFRGRSDQASQSASEAARIARIVRDVNAEVDALSDVVTYADVPDPKALRRLRELLPTVEHPGIRYLGLSSLAWAEGLETGFSEGVIRQFHDAEGLLSGTGYRQLQGTAAANLAQIYLYHDQPVEAYEHATRALAILLSPSPEILAFMYSLQATAASAIGKHSQAASALRHAIEVGAPGRRAPWAEVMVAAVAVLVASNAPLLAAKVWGAITGADFAGYLVSPDRALGERLLASARRAADPIAFEVALRAGRTDGTDPVIEEVLAHLDVVEESARQSRPARLRHGILTARELEVLALVGAGKSDSDIATALFISPKTASVHVSNAKAKLGVETRLEAALWARDRGLVASESND